MNVKKYELAKDTQAPLNRSQRRARDRHLKAIQRRVSLKAQKFIKDNPDKAYEMLEKQHGREIAAAEKEKAMLKAEKLDVGPGEKEVSAKWLDENRHKEQLLANSLKR